MNGSEEVDKFEEERVGLAWIYSEEGQSGAGVNVRDPTFRVESLG